ncbi:hypothetical protein BH10CYA1_BH10CYA1_58620 [soil metagenome]
MSRYKIAGAHIAHQNIDGEIILVDLKSGAYYSIGGGGGAIWNYLSAGFTQDQTVEALSLAYSTDKSEIGESVQELLKTLVQDGLIVKAADGDYTTEPAHPEITQTQGSPMAPVLIEKFSDLSDALIYDPIHDFDQTTGWPNVQEEVTITAQKFAADTKV